MAQIISQSAIIAVDGTKPAVAEIILNATLTGETNWTYVNETHSSVEYDTSATGFTLAATSTKIGSVSLGRQGNIQLDLAKEGVTLERDDVLTIAVAAVSGTTDAAGSLNWIEE